MPASSEPRRPFPTAALFTILAVFFTATAAAAVGWRDAGELGAAAFHLGIAHPTGFPLPLMCSKAVALLLPLGDTALRLSIACGLAMAGAATLLAQAVHGLVRPRSIAPLAAAALVCLGFLSSPTLAWFGTSMEVYAWAALLFSAALLAAVRASRSRDPRAAILACLALGLAASTHASAVIGTAAAAAAALMAVRPRARAAAAGLVLAGLGALVLAYLPLRSLAAPPVMWDDLSTPSAMLDHLSAARIREAYAGRAAGSALPWDVLSLGRLLAEDLGAVAFVLAPAGVLLGWRRSAPVTAALAASAAAGILYALILNPMGIADRQTGFLTTIACLGLASVAAGEIVGKISRSRRTYGMALAGLLLLMVPLLRPADACKIRHDDMPVLWAGSALDGLPPGALVLCTSDEMCGLGLWLGAVEGRRPDCSVVPRQHLWHDRVVRQALGRGHGDLASRTLEAGVGAGPRLAYLVSTAGERGTYWEVGDGQDLGPAFGRRPPPLEYGHGASAPLAAIGTSAGRPADLEALKHRFLRWLALAGHDPASISPCDLSFLTRRMLARDFLAAGLVLAWSGRMARSREAFYLATTIKPDYAPALVNLAILEAEAGRIESGIVYARAAVRSEPQRLKARATLGRLLMAAGRVEEGRKILESIGDGGNQ